MFIVSFILSNISTAENRYFAPPIPCRLVKATHVLDTAITGADETITLSDGTTTIGTITIAYSGSAEGDCDEMSYAAAVELDKDTPLKIAIAGTSTGGAGTLALMFSEYHVA